MCLSIFKSPCESSASNAFENCERSGRVTILNDKFKVSQVGLAHRGGNGTVPIWLIDADEHSLNHILRLFVESVRFGKVSTTTLQISEHRQVARHIITITNPLACGQTLSGTRIRCGKIPGITVDLSQFEHGVCFHPVELSLGRELAGVFQIPHCLLSVTFLCRQFSEKNQHLRLMSALLL